MLILALIIWGIGVIGLGGFGLLIMAIASLKSPTTTGSLIIFMVWVILWPIMLPLTWVAKLVS